MLTPPIPAKRNGNYIGIPPPCPYQNASIPPPQWQKKTGPEPPPSISIPKVATAQPLEPKDYNLIGSDKYLYPPYKGLLPPPQPPSFLPPISPRPIEPSQNNFMKPNSTQTDFTRPLTRLDGKETNTVEVIPKAKTN